MITTKVFYLLSFSHQVNFHLNTFIYSNFILNKNHIFVRQHVFNTKFNCSSFQHDQVSKYKWILSNIPASTTEFTNSTDTISINTKKSKNARPRFNFIHRSSCLSKTKSCVYEPKVLYNLKYNLSILLGIYIFKKIYF